MKDNQFYKFLWIIGICLLVGHRGRLQANPIGVVGNERAVYVSVDGTEMGVDEKFNAKVLTLLTSLLVREKETSPGSGKFRKWTGKIGTYRLLGRGDEGGKLSALK